jgi:hypothetical protein
MKKYLVAGVLLIAAGVFLLPWLKKREAQSRLLEQRVYQVLKKHEPELFSRLAQKFQAMLDSRLQPREFETFAEAEISAVATRRLASASDASVVDVIREMIVSARKLQAMSGDACFRFWFPEVSGPPDVAGRPDLQNQQRLRDALAEVIRSAAEDPVPYSDEPAVKEHIATVVNEMYEKYGSDAQMLAHASDPRVDRDKVCAITIALYERVLAWPPADSSAMIRAIAQGR